MISSTRDNDSYAFADAANVDRDYDPNGLNQYGTVGSDAVVYDDNGNLVDDSYTEFAYDTANMLVASDDGNNAATMRYDPLGHLFEVSDGASTTQFLYDGADLVGEYNGAGALQARYVHGVGAGDDPLVAFDGSGVADSAIRQLYADRLGSIALTSDRLGSAMNISTYGEWGIPGASNAGAGAGGVGRFQYTGQAWLPELGLYHYKARAYSPTLGRFMQPDPIGYGDGMNMYAYVGNNPTNFVDPTGMLEMLNCLPYMDRASTEGILVCGSRPRDPIYVPPTAAYDLHRSIVSNTSLNTGVDLWAASAAAIAAQGASQAAANAVNNGKDGKGEPQKEKEDPTGGVGPYYEGTNYCGAEGGTELPRGSWNRACYNHDICYSVLGQTKLSCDVQFRHDVFYQCYRFQGNKPDGCGAVANVAFFLVRAGGGPSYDSGQTNARRRAGP